MPYIHMCNICFKYYTTRAFLLEVLCLHIKLTTKHVTYSCIPTWYAEKSVNLSSSIPLSIPVRWSPCFHLLLSNNREAVWGRKTFAVKRRYIGNIPAFARASCLATIILFTTCHEHHVCMRIASGLLYRKFSLASSRFSMRN